MKNIKKLFTVSICACSCIAPFTSQSAEESQVTVVSTTTTTPEPRNGAITGADKVRMAKAAEADCYAQLVEQIKGLQVSENSTVMDVVNAYFDQMSSAQGFVQGAVLKEPLYQDDTCLIKAELTLDQIAENLTKSIKAVDGKVKDQFEAIKRFNKKKLVTVTGVGALIAPETLEKGELSPRDTGELDTIKHLVGPGQYKVMALKAARLDALTKLAASIKGVRVSSTMSIQNAAGSSWQQADTEAVIQGARVIRYAAVDKDLVQCWMEINLETVVENIQKNSTLFSNGKEVSVENIKRLNKLAKVVSVGQGAVVKPGEPVDAAVDSSPITGSVK